MRKNILIIFILAMTFCFTGCGERKIEELAENIKKLELAGNLVTYEVYYHNVLEYEKENGSGIAHLFEKDKKLFAEYTGTIKIGVDLSKVQIEVDESTINVFIPKATVIGEPNVDKDDFKSENFIESKDGINKNKITADDLVAAFDKAQEEIKKNASTNSEVLSIAQKRAKSIIEENIKQFSGVTDDLFNINWEYGV